MKIYNGYTDEELDEIIGQPENIKIITSDWFGAWLMRRDERIQERKVQEVIDSRKYNVIWRYDKSTKSLVLVNLDTKNGCWIPIQDLLEEDPELVTHVTRLSDIM